MASAAEGMETVICGRSRGGGGGPMDKSDSDGLGFKKKKKDGEKAKIGLLIPRVKIR